jgi:predicted O-linked N-acetylglucosamine transferase (SPINDLY family)
VRSATISNRKKAAKALLESGYDYSVKGQQSLALTLFEKALELDPKLEIPVLLARGNAYGAEERWDLAVAQADLILAREPDHYEALNLRRKSLHLMCWSEETVPAIRRVLALKPNRQLHSDLLFYLLYPGNSTPEILYEESRRWFELYAAPLAQNIQPHTNDRDPRRKLKVGYLSPDLYDHTIMKLLPAVLEHHDHEQFDIRFYSITTRPDKISERLSEVADVVSLPPVAEEIAARVRADGIDILLDLAGHTMDANAYVAFAMKPAPVQVSWMGVMSTTGMPTIDYYIGDANSPCPGTEHLFSETVYRLPRISGSYRTPIAIQNAESPFFRNGFITFGSFNNPRKITRDVVKMWSVILHLVPGSRMFLKYLDLDKPVIQELFRGWFREDGIAEERIHFEGPTKGFGYLRKWNEVDISLDTYPYNGGTTTLDALWVGVPVVTLAGRMAVSCTGHNILSALGLPVARSAEQYIQTALFLAQNIPKTPGMRNTVHKAMAASPLMDEKGLVQALEAAFRDMWVKWCERP